MRDHRPTLANEWITASRLKQIQKHAGEILAINQCLSTLLPKSLRPHVRAANLRDGCLAIEVASAAIKMKLDYDRLYLLNQLRTNGFSRLITIELKINPDLYRDTESKSHEPSSVPRPPLSDNAAHALLMIADSASPKVKKRLESLAKLSKKSTS